MDLFDGVPENRVGASYAPDANVLRVHFNANAHHAPGKGGYGCK